jgi:hypothetical protein
MVNDLVRVFFHELGHFVARELNHEYFNSTKVKSIDFYLVNTSMQLYEGELKVELPEGGIESLVPTPENLPEYLASSTYGCIFQSYWLKQDLNECFNVNGNDDFSMWMKSLKANNVEEFKGKFIEVEKQHFEYLKENHLLDIYMDLDVHDFIYKTGQEYSNYHVDIEKLKKAIMPFIDKHHDTYLLLIEKYKDILLS